MPAQFAPASWVGTGNLIPRAAPRNPLSDAWSGRVAERRQHPRQRNCTIRPPGGECHGLAQRTTRQSHGDAVTNGEVLIIGAPHSPSILDVAELYDPPHYVDQHRRSDTTVSVTRRRSCDRQGPGRGWRLRICRLLRVIRSGHVNEPHRRPDNGASLSGDALQDGRVLVTGGSGDVDLFSACRMWNCTIPSRALELP
jgi:hypothetical protein